MTDDRLPAVVFGVTIGTCTGWDQVDDWAIVLYEFEPDKDNGIPAGDLTVDYERGLFQIFDDDSVEQYSDSIIERMYEAQFTDD